MGYYIGINTGDLEDVVEDYIMKNLLDGDPEDLWSQNGWGFFEELGTITLENEDIFTSDLQLEGITTIVNSKNPNINKFIELCYDYGYVFFNDNYEEISDDDWKKQTQNLKKFTISICECEPEG